MTPDRQMRSQALGETPRMHSARLSEETEARAVATSGEQEDWPLMSGLLGGLFLAVLFNTFIALIPG